MDNLIQRYAEYKGLEFTEETIATYTPLLQRAISLMETKLGFPLDPEKRPTIDIAGVSKHGCDCRMENIDSESLDPAPEITGSLTMAPFDKRMQNQRVNPFASIYNVYVAKRVEGTGEVVVLQEATNYQPIIRSNGFGNYIKGCQNNHCAVVCGDTCKDCVSLLIDGDWLSLDNLPDELIFMLFDVMDWLEDGGFTNTGVTSESVDGHSVSYGDWAKVHGYTPYDDPSNALILARYLGAFGDISRQYIH